MCIFFCIVNESAKDGEYKLILAANRDENYDRPALIAGPWEEDEQIIGGRDMTPGREGGTWLAISIKNNRFKLGTLLNINGEEIHPDAAPRGNIVRNYVQNSKSNAEYCQQLIESDMKFNNFNLVTIEISDKAAHTIHYCNVSSSMHEWPQNEVLGFSNSLAHSPYKKVEAGKKKFQEIVNRQNQSKEELVHNLNEMLSSREKHWPDDELRRRSPRYCESLCSICVKISEGGYGTRTHTIILVDANNKVDFYEETMASEDPNGKWMKTHIETKF